MIESGLKFTIKGLTLDANMTTHIQHLAVRLDLLGYVKARLMTLEGVLVGDLEDIDLLLKEIKRVFAGSILSLDTEAVVYQATQPIFEIRENDGFSTD